MDNGATSVNGGQVNQWADESGNANDLITLYYRSRKIDEQSHFPDYWATYSVLGQ
jgi:hypothetical protein